MHYIFLKGSYCDGLKEVVAGIICAVNTFGKREANQIAPSTESIH